MKITKTQLKQIIKEELGTMAEAEQWKMGRSMKAGDRARQQKLDRIRKQRQTVDNLAAITSLANLGDTPAAGVDDVAEPPHVDIVNALDMANRMEDSGDMADLRYVIEALEQALEKLGEQEEPRDPYADESPYDAGY